MLKNIFWEAFFVLRGAFGNRCGAIGGCAFAVWQGVNGIFLSMNGLHWVILGSFSTCPGGMRNNLLYLHKKRIYVESLRAIAAFLR